jgi:hypothetical protein
MEPERKKFKTRKDLYDEQILIIMVRVSFGTNLSDKEAAN